MELSKTIELTNSLSDKIRNAYKKDLEKGIQKLIEEFDIYKRGTKELISKNDLVSIFFNENLEIKYCCAATKSGTKCKNKALDNMNFCGKHLYTTENLRDMLHKRYNYNEQQENHNKDNHDNQNNEENLYIIEHTDTNTDIDKTHINNKNLKNVLIENAFYYVDSNWIYDKKTMERVGYIEKTGINKNEDKFILTSDPFILQLNF
jgi:hypothetical protein